MTNATREADEYLSAGVLSELGFGPVRQVKERLEATTDDQLVAVVAFCCDPDEEIPEDIGGEDYIDWIYEIEKDKRLDIDGWYADLDKREDMDVLSAYESRVNRGVYDE